MVSLVTMGKFGQNGKLSQTCKVHLGLNVSSSAYNDGCIVNGGNAIAAIRVLLVLIHGIVFSLRGFGILILREMLPFIGITHITILQQC